MALTLAELNNRLAQARAAAREKGVRQEFGIGQGLRVRVYPTGSASFAYRYKAPAGPMRVFTLSPIGKRVAALDLEAAQELHRAAKRQRDSAIDPKAQRDWQRQEAARQATAARAKKAEQAFTVRRMVSDYIDHVSTRKKTWKEDERIFDRYVLPEIGELPVTSVDVILVRKVLGKLDSTPAMKKNTQAACRACWVWHDPVGANPWKAERVPAPKPRERILTLNELRELLYRLDIETGFGRDIVELILLTGVRREEASGARREEFDGREWRIPAERAKNRREHLVLLSDQAGKLVGRVMEGHGSEWLFPSPRTDKSVAPEFGYKWLKAGGVTYTLHDLRRTLASHLGEQSVPDGVIDRILAHRKQGIVRHYNHARLAEPARKAWQGWADYLGELGRSKVVERDREKPRRPLIGASRFEEAAFQARQLVTPSSTIASRVRRAEQAPLGPFEDAVDSLAAKILAEAEASRGPKARKAKTRAHILRRIGPALKPDVDDRKSLYKAYADSFDTSPADFGDDRDRPVCRNTLRNHIDEILQYQRNAQ